MNSVISLRNRLEKIGVDIVIHINAPWIYMHSVNGSRVKETYLGNHGFTIAFTSNDAHLTNTSEIFRVIRKYK